jgi:acetolactate decarboxylase
MLVFTGCQGMKGVVMQVSTLDSLKAGNYDGLTTLAEVKKYGDMGIGTYDRLDGEMILVNGDFYQIRFNGSVTIPSGSKTTPFAIVTGFEPTVDQSMERAMSLQQLYAYLDKIVPDKNALCMFYIRGNFTSIKTRSVPAQTKPYQPLERVLQRQSIFEFNDEYGTLVGIRIPEYMGGINTPGYHFHFLNEARNGGGHVLDATMNNIRVRADTRHDAFHMIMPPK